MLEISTDLLNDIVTHAEQCPGSEACGLLFGAPGRVIAVERCRNVAADPRVRFEIDPVQLIAAHRRSRSGGPPVTGHYHSHPGGAARPSPRDAADAACDGSIWMIVAGREATAWRATADGPVEGRFQPLALRVVP